MTRLLVAVLTALCLFTHAALAQDLRAAPQASLILASGNAGHVQTAGLTGAVVDGQLHYAALAPAHRMQHASSIQPSQHDEQADATALPDVAPNAGPFAIIIPASRPQPRPSHLLWREELAALPHTLVGASDFMCLAVTIYHEARGESLEGQAAVASVILNRAAVPHRWGTTVCDVTVPVQFSYLGRDLSFAPIEDYDAWRTAVSVATVALIEGPDPFLDGADHYHTVNVDPAWNDGMDVIARIGTHIFYADPRSEVTG